jgi:hypothetical protein
MGRLQPARWAWPTWRRSGSGLCQSMLQAPDAACLAGYGVRASMWHVAATAYSADVAESLLFHAAQQVQPVAARTRGEVDCAPLAILTTTARLFTIATHCLRALGLRGRCSARGKSSGTLLEVAAQRACRLCACAAGQGEMYLLQVMPSVTTSRHKFRSAVWLSALSGALALAVTAGPARAWRHWLSAAVGLSACTSSHLQFPRVHLNSFEPFKHPFVPA